MNSLSLILVRGLPGSGKSTAAKHILKTDHPFYLGGREAIHIEADMYHMVDGVYMFRGENVKAAHQWCRLTTSIYLNNKISVVVSNTFTRHSEIYPYEDLAKLFGIKLIVYRCNNNFGNIHAVPQNVLSDMKNRFEDYPGELVWGETY